MQSGLVLRGWRDRGSCFQLRASSPLTPELLTEIEAEVLLLAPNNMHNSSLRLFGLQLEGLKVTETGVEYAADAAADDVSGFEDVVLLVLLLALLVLTDAVVVSATKHGHHHEPTNDQTAVLGLLSHLLAAVFNLSQKSLSQASKLC